MYCLSASMLLCLYPYLYLSQPFYILSPPSSTRTRQLLSDIDLSLPFLSLSPL